MIFILHEPRSGSNFLARELTNNFNIFFPPESNIVHSILHFEFDVLKKSDIAYFLDRLYADRKFLDWGIKRESLHQVIESRCPLPKEELLSLIIRFSADQDVKKIGIKLGPHLNDVPLILRHLSEASFVALVRDGRAVYNSKRRSINTKTGRAFETYAGSAASVWNSFNKRVLDLSKQIGCLTILSYEELIKNSKESLNRIAATTNLDPRSEVADIYQVPERYGYLHTNVAKPPLVERIDSWKEELPVKEILRFEYHSWETLKALGYPPLFIKNRLIYALAQKYLQTSNFLKKIFTSTN